MLRVRLSLFTVIILASAAFCDTFVNKKSGESFDGYLISKKVGDDSVIKTDKGLKRINLKDYDLQANRKGRNEQVIVLKIDKDLKYHKETSEFIKALKWSADRGPYFILVEIDSPGGRIDLCREICEAIDDVNGCDVYAFIGGGENSGAYSAAAAVSLACDKIYMTIETAIGAATPYMMTQTGVKDADPNFLKDFSGVFYNLAKEKGRPGAVAAAMVDNGLEVVEIFNKGKKQFVFAGEQGGKEVVKTWVEKGKLLTIPASDAFETGICDQIVDDIDDLLVRLDAQDVQIVYNRSPQKARLEIQKAEERVDQTYARVQEKIKTFNTSKEMNYSKSYHLYHALIRDVREAVSLAEKYPDLKQHSNLPWLKNFLHNLESALRN